MISFDAWLPIEAAFIIGGLDNIMQHRCGRDAEFDAFYMVESRDARFESFDQEPARRTGIPGVDHGRRR